MKNPTYPHKNSSPTVQNDATIHSGCLKGFLILFIVFAANSAFADEISSTGNYLPGGDYRMFGAGRGEVEKSDEW